MRAIRLLPGPRTATVAAVALALAACADPAGVRLEPTEARALAAALVDLGFAAAHAAVDEVGGDAPREEEVDRGFAVDVPCPGGGHLSVAGHARGTIPASGTYELAIDAAASPAECGLAVQEEAIVLRAAPDIGAALAAVDGDPLGDQTLTLLGTVTWTGPGGAGTCEAELRAVEEPETRTRVVGGSICGLSLEPPA